MTNKEAIEELKKVDTLDMPARLCEAHYMAIKALEQEPCGDAIGRQTVLDILEREGHKWGNDYRDWVDAIEEIKKLPPVNPQEPKTVHWIDMDEGFSPCECSECKSVEFIKSKYCPNCGCRMVEPQESEE